MGKLVRIGIFRFYLYNPQTSILFIIFQIGQRALKNLVNKCLAACGKLICGPFPLVAAQSNHRVTEPRPQGADFYHGLIA
jgi:hypothetical protein